MEERFSQFQDVVETTAELRGVIPEPMRAIKVKVIDHLDELCREFIAASPFAILASRSSNGWLRLAEG